MNFISRRKRPKMGLRESAVIRCPGHLKWVRGHSCCIEGAGKSLDKPGRPIVHFCEGKIEAHHVREGDHGHGIGQKPDDSAAVPLCSLAHKRGHDKGWRTFEIEWRIDLSSIAEQLWTRSPHGQKYRRGHP